MVALELARMESFRFAEAKLLKALAEERIDSIPTGPMAAIQQGAPLMTLD